MNHSNVLREFANNYQSETLEVEQDLGTSRAILDLQVQIDCIKGFLSNIGITDEMFKKSIEEKYKESPYKELKNLIESAEKRLNEIKQTPANPA